eukprot:SAG31_NODE_7100_length_1788_cov_1.500296_2_plen_30_part_01
MFIAARMNYGRMSIANLFSNKQIHIADNLS